MLLLEAKSTSKSTKMEVSVSLKFFIWRHWAPGLHTPQILSHSLRKYAYSNILRILPPKNENFQMKNSDIFLISAQNIDVGTEAVLMSTHNLCFEQQYEKYQSLLPEKFQFLEMKFSLYLNRPVFVMVCGFICGFYGFVFICSFSLGAREGCAGWLWHTLGIFTYI